MTIFAYHILFKYESVPNNDLAVYKNDLILVRSGNMNRYCILFHSEAFLKTTIDFICNGATCKSLNANIVTFCLFHAPTDLIRA